MTGTRKYLDDEGHLSLAEGEYGQDANGIWYARAPGQHMANLSGHTVIEHEDGTITVSPSISIRDAERELWHGYLERGVWRSV